MFVKCELGNIFRWIHKCLSNHMYCWIRLWFQSWDKSSVEFIHKVMALSSSIIFFPCISYEHKRILIFFGDNKVCRKQAV